MKDPTPRFPFSCSWTYCRLRRMAGLGFSLLSLWTGRDGEAQPMWQDGLTRKAVKLVLAGDVTALRLCLDGDGSHNYALFISMMLDWTAALLALLRAAEIGDSLWIKHLGVSARQEMR